MRVTIPCILYLYTLFQVNTDVLMPGSGGMSDGWFHTWPEREKSYERVEGVEGSPHHRAPVPLSSLLSHMSLAYSPITKGLHVLQPAVDATETPQDDAQDGHDPG